MTELMLPLPATNALVVPMQIAQLGPRAADAWIEFFTAKIANVNTRMSYARACRQFLNWCAAHGLDDLRAVKPPHVAAWREIQAETAKPATVKLKLSALKMLFGHLQSVGAIDQNPVASVQPPKLIRRQGATPVLAGDEAQAIIDAIDLSTPAGLRDRALIGTMIYTFARISAALSLSVGNLRIENRRRNIHFIGKGGVEQRIPCNHTLDEYLDAYLELLGTDPRTPLFQSIDRKNGPLTGKPLRRENAYAMVRRRAKAADIDTKICNHTFRGTGITALLKNGAPTETAQHLAGHADPRTTQLYGRRNQETTLDDVERIRLT